MIRFTIVTAAYLVFWGPLFLVTLVHARMDWTDARSSVTHQVTMITLITMKMMIIIRMKIIM